MPLSNLRELPTQLSTKDRNAMKDDMANGSAEVTLITAEGGRRWLNLRELYHYRELLFVLSARDVKVRYKQTVLGIVWALLQPLASMLLFTLVFGRLAKLPSDGFPYPIFVFAGLLPWTFFANSIASSAESIVGASSLITKVYFPRIIIPLASVCTALVDFAIAFIILLILMLFYGVGWSINLLFAPVLKMQGGRD